MIRNLMDVIWKNRDALKSSKILPINKIFSVICSNENQIRRDKMIKTDVIQNLRNDNDSYTFMISETEPSDLSK